MEGSGRQLTLCPHVGKFDEVLLHLHVALKWYEVENFRDARENWKKALQRHCAEHHSASRFACFFKLQLCSLSPGGVVCHFRRWCHLHSGQVCEQRLDAGPLGAAMFPHNGFPGFHPVLLVIADEVD